MLDNTKYLHACNIIKKSLQHSCFPAKFAKFLRTFIMKNICERLLLKLFSPALTSSNLFKKVKIHSLK